MRGFEEPCEPVLRKKQLGSEGAQWWVDYPDAARSLPANSIFHRCNLSGTCPKVIEHFGGSEVFALKMTMEWVGTSADFLTLLLPDLTGKIIPDA